MQTIIGVLKTSFVITKGEEHLKEWSGNILIFILLQFLQLLLQLLLLLQFL